MAKQIANLVHQRAPQAAAARAASRTLFGMRFRDMDGVIEHGARAFSFTEIFWGYEADGAQVCTVGDDIAFVTPQRDIHGLRYVPGRSWCNSDDIVSRAFASFSPRPRRRRIGGFVADLFAAHEQVSWVDVTHSRYPFLKLDATGGALVNGQALAVGGAPIELPNGWFASHAGAVVMVADVSGVRDRYRFANGGWQRLVHRRRVVWSCLAAGATGEPQGEVTMTAPGVPPLCVPGGSPFTVHFAGARTLCRYRGDETIYALRPTCDAEEFVVEGAKLWRIEGARDWWSFELAGVPGHDGEKPVMFKEVMPGLTIFHNGKVEVANRMFLGGEPIHVRHGAVNVSRAAGVGEPQFVSAGGVAVGFVYSACGDWYKMTAVSPDQKRFTWRRLVGQHNPIDAWTAHADLVIGETPLLRWAGLAVAAVWRFIVAAAKEPVFAPLAFGIFGLYVVVHVVRASLLCVAAPVNLLWKLIRRLRRSLELNQPDGR